MTIYLKDIYPATLSLRIIHHYALIHTHIYTCMNYAHIFIEEFSKDNLNYLNASGQNKFERVNYIAQYGLHVLDMICVRHACQWEFSIICQATHISTYILCAYTQI